MRSRSISRGLFALLLLAAVALWLAGDSPGAVVAVEPELQNGDFLVGTAVTGGFGHSEGRIVRVRDGVATEFCASTPDAFWNRPEEVLIDSQGRVVFVAYLGSFFQNGRGYGLWRCDALGAAPTLLGAFGSPLNNPVLATYARPLGDRAIAFVGGLHRKRSKGLDLNTMTMVNKEFYVFAVSDVYGDRGHADTIAYNPATGEWTESFEDPVPTDLYGNTSQIDMINANGSTFSVAGGCMRGFSEPVALEFEIGEFSGGLAFQSLHDVCGAIVDDSLTPNGNSGCGPHSDGVTLSRPTASDGILYPMNGLFQVAWGDSLILENNYGGGGWLFLPDVSLALFDLIPSNDTGAMYHDAFCDHQKKLDFTGWHTTLSDSDGTPRGVTRMTPDGTAGTQGYPYYRIVGLGSSQEVEILAEGLNDPGGIDVYPGFTPTLGGITFFVRIDSPVDVLITASDGRRIGVDPDTGLFVNDYGDAGYDSNTNEPHIYGIRDPLAGDFTITTKGTGTGPYTITTYGANLGTDAITTTSFTGNAAPGSTSSHDADLTSDGVVTNGDPATATPTPTETPAPTSTPTPTATATPWPDIDGDGVPGDIDNCVSDANPTQLNTDNAPIITPGVVPVDVTLAHSDPLGDACDDDDDNDGISDIAEPAGCTVGGGGGSGPLDPLLFDSDGDRTGDAAECALGSNPADAGSKPARPMPGDSDGDGLPDALEQLIASSTGNVDSDLDGIHDGIEYRGYNTANNSTDSDADGCADDTEITDVTGSGKTDVVDLFLVAGSFGQSSRANHDITKEGNINVLDLFLVAGNVTQTFCSL